MTFQGDGVVVGYPSFGVALNIRAPQVTATAASRFDIDVNSPPAARTQQITISDEIDGTSATWPTSWSVKSVGADWLVVSPASGSTSPPSPLTLTIDVAKLAGYLSGGYFTTKVVE